MRTGEEEIAIAKTGSECRRFPYWRAEALILCMTNVNATPFRADWWTELSLKCIQTREISFLAV